MRSQLPDDPELGFKERCIGSLLIGYGIVMGGLIVIGLGLFLFSISLLAIALSTIFV